MTIVCVYRIIIPHAQTHSWPVVTRPPVFFLTARTLIGQPNTHTLVTLNISAVFAPLDQSLFERVLHNKLHVGLLRPLLPEKTNNYVLQLTPMPAR